MHVCVPAYVCFCQQAMQHGLHPLKGAHLPLLVQLLLQADDVAAGGGRAGHILHQQLPIVGPLPAHRDLVTNQQASRQRLPELLRSVGIGSGGWEFRVQPLHTPGWQNRVGLCQTRVLLDGREVPLWWQTHTHDGSDSRSSHSAGQQEGIVT